MSLEQLFRTKIAGICKKYIELRRTTSQGGSRILMGGWYGGGLMSRRRFIVDFATLVLVAHVALLNPPAKFVL